MEVCAARHRWQCHFVFGKTSSIQFRFSAIYWKIVVPFPARLKLILVNNNEQRETPKTKWESIRDDCGRRCFNSVRELFSVFGTTFQTIWMENFEFSNRFQLDRRCRCGWCALIDLFQSKLQFRCLHRILSLASLLAAKQKLNNVFKFYHNKLAKNVPPCKWQFAPRPPSDTRIDFAATLTRTHTFGDRAVWYEYTKNSVGGSGKTNFD